MTFYPTYTTHALRHVLKTRIRSFDFTYCMLLCEVPAVQRPEQLSPSTAQTQLPEVRV